MERRKMIDTPIIIGCVVVLALFAAMVVVLATKDSRSSNGASGSSNSQGAAATDGPMDPKKFPLPDGASLSYGTDSGGSYSALITVSDGKSAYDWWLSELPKQGFTITDKSSYGTSDSFIGSIKISGRGFSEGSLSIVGTNVAMSLTGNNTSG